MMDDSGTLPVPIGAGGNRALSTLDQLAEIPEEDIWLAKQRAGDVRASSQFAADSPVEEGVWSEPVSEKSSNSVRFWSAISWFRAENHQK